MPERSDEYLRKAVIFFGILDGILFIFLGWQTVLGLRIEIHNLDYIPTAGIAFAVPYLLLVLSLPVSCFGLASTRRWAMILYLAGLPLRVLFNLYSFKILLLATFWTGPATYQAFAWIILALEFVRVYVTLVAFKRARSPEWQSPFAAWTPSRRRLSFAAGYVTLSLLSVVAGWDRSAPPDKFAQAARLGYTRTARDLLDAGLDVNAPDQFEITPIEAAALYARPEILNLLIDHGADVHFVSEDGTPLIRRVLSFSWSMPERKQDVLDVLRILLEQGADPNARDPLGSAPLHSAVSLDRLDLVKLLIEQGARTDARDKQDQTPLDLALKQKPANQELVTFLREHTPVEQPAQTPPQPSSENTPSQTPSESTPPDAKGAPQ